VSDDLYTMSREGLILAARRARGAEAFEHAARLIESNFRQVAEAELKTAREALEKIYAGAMPR
jgi:hypothetical protein